jgi:anti-anti-sigma factor
MSSTVVDLAAEPPDTAPLPRLAHPCTIPISTEHLWELTADWVAGGLAAGERVLYFEDDTAGELLDRLADDEVPVHDALDDGQLVVVPTEQTRAALSGPTDDIGAMVDAQARETTRQGWPGLRLAGESGFLLQEPGGLRRVVEVEHAVDLALAEHPSARLLCRYDRRRFPDEALARLRALHPEEVVVPAVYDDSLLRITRTTSGMRLAGEVDRSNHARIRAVLGAALDEALRSPDAATDIVLDLASLRFVDVSAAVGLVHAAEEFPSTHRLVLTGVRPRVVRVLDRCGAPFAAQLVVAPRTGAPR